MTRHFPASLRVGAEVFKKPILSFGIITDIQYADCDDKPAWYDPEKCRYYRGALNQVQKAFQHWTNSENHHSVVLQLGDVIDGINNKLSLNSHQALRKTLEVFDSFPNLPTYHVLGNHELYNFKRTEIASLFLKPLMQDKIDMKAGNPLVNFGSQVNSEDDHLLYYSFKPKEGVKLIALDCYDISVIGHDPNSESYKEAASILKKYHNHEDYELWDTDGPLTGIDRRFQQQNGALSKKQLSWLDSELQKSDEANEKVVVFGHVGIQPDSVDHTCLLWNYDEVLKIFASHHCVIAYFCGHTHASGRSVDKKGIHYVAFRGVIETDPETSSFASVSVFDDHIKIEGHGVEESCVLTLNDQTKPLVPVCSQRSDNELILTNFEKGKSGSVQHFGVTNESLPFLL